MTTHEVELRRPADGAPRDEHGPGRGGADLALAAGVAVVVLIVFLLPVLFHDQAFPVGPDVPVYLWWARVAAGEGISLVGARPGTPALVPTLGGALGQGPVEALAGLQYAMGPAIGLAAAALLRGRRGVGRAGWVLGALLAGVWATHLGDGYLANLVYAACFLAAAAGLARRTPRGTAAAALLLGAGGLAHPQFFVVGAVVLLLTAGWAAWHDRGFAWGGDAGRITIGLGAGALIVGGGLLAALGGPARLSGDTSKDAYLRRTADLETLRRSYLERFRLNWTRYAPWVTLPLAVLGAFRARGFLQRFLVSWAAFTAVTFLIAALTRAFPPDRVVTFAFCIPLLGALALAWIGPRLAEATGNRWVAWASVAAIGVLVVFPSIRAWISSPDFVTASEMDHAIEAGRIAATTDPGTPLVFVANDLETNGLFHMAHVFNVARAAVPAERAGDVYVFMGTASDLLEGRSSVRGIPNYDAASARSLEELPDGPSAIFVVAGLDDDTAELDDPRLVRWSPAVATTVPGPVAVAALDGEPTSSTSGAMIGAAIRTLLLLTVIGLGWGWWAMGDAASALAAAPALGLATLTITSLALERIGAPFGTPGGATLAVASAGACGYALLLSRIVRERRARRSPVIVEGETRTEP